MSQFNASTLGQNKNSDRKLFEGTSECITDLKSTNDHTDQPIDTPEFLLEYLDQEIVDQPPRKGLKLRELNLDLHEEIKIQNEKVVRDLEVIKHRSTKDSEIVSSKGDRKNGRQIKKSRKAFLIFDIVRVNKPTYDRFYEQIRSIHNPFGEDTDKGFYRNMVVFFLHLINYMIYCHHYNGAKDELWFKYSPISYELGLKLLPYVFDTQMLTEYGIPIAKTSEGKMLDRLLGEFIDYKPHEFYGENHKNNKCREFILKPEKFNYIFQCSKDNLFDHAEYLNQKGRRYNLAKGHNQKTTNENNLDHLCSSINKTATRSKITFPPEIKGNGKDVKEARNRYIRTYNNMRANQINYSNAVKCIIEYQILALNAESVNKQTYYLLISLQLEQALWVMLDRGCNLISGDINNPDMEDIILEYFPKYKVAAVGSRMFEEGGGFQTLPSEIKGVVVSSDMVNYDIESCQLTILCYLFKQAGINNKLVKSLSGKKGLRQFLKKLDIDKDTFKKLFYSLLFSAGNGPHPNYLDNSAIGKWLLFNFAPEDADDIYTDFYNETKQLRVDLRALPKILIEELQYRNQHGIFIKNKLGIPLRLETSRDGRRVLMTSENLKRVLSHVIQGLEVDYTLRCLEKHGGSACEHDGLLLHKDTPLTEKHKYLNMIEKPFKTSKREDGMNDHSVDAFLKKNRRSWGEIESFDGSGLFPVEEHVQDMIKKGVDLSNLSEPAKPENDFDFHSYRRTDCLNLPDFETAIKDAVVDDKYIDLNKISKVILESISGLEIYNLNKLKGKVRKKLPKKYSYLGDVLSEYEQLDKETKDSRVNYIQDIDSYYKGIGEWKKYKCLTARDEILDAKTQISYLYSNIEKKGEMNPNKVKLDCALLEIQKHIDVVLLNNPIVNFSTPEHKNFSSIYSDLYLSIVLILKRDFAYVSGLMKDIHKKSNIEMMTKSLNKTFNKPEDFKVFEDDGFYDELEKIAQSFIFSMRDS